MANHNFGRDALDVFGGATRISEVEGRGTLPEHVGIRRQLAETSDRIARHHAQMGPITHLIHLAANTELAMVPAVTTYAAVSA